MGAHFNTVKILSLGTVGKFCKIEKQQNVPNYLIYFVSTYINEILIELIVRLKLLYAYT